MIGYSLLPLYPRHRLLPNDVYSLPIASKLPRSYLLPYAEGRDDDSIAFRDRGAKSFTVRIAVQSSIFNQDESLHNFISQFPNVKELHAVGTEKGRDLCSKAVDHVSKADPLLAIRFMPSLADYLLDLLMSRSASPLSQLFAFQALLAYMHRIAEYFNESHRCSLIIAYCTYRLDNDGMRGPPYQLVNKQPPQQPQPSTTLPPHHSTGSLPAASVASTLSSSSPASSPTPSVALPPVYSVLSRVWLAALTARDQPPAASASAFSFGRPVSTSNGIRPLMTSSSSASSSSSSSSSSASSSSAPPASSSASALSSPSSSPPERSLIVYSWFLFESMMKSLCMERCQLGALQPQYKDEFLSNTRQLIDVLVVLVSKHRSVGVTVVRQLVNNLAAFLLDLFAVIDKSAVVDLISRFLLPLRTVQHDPVLIEMTFAFHSILLDYPYYMDLCELHTLNIEDITQAAHDTAAAQHEAAMHASSSPQNEADDEPSVDGSLPSASPSSSTGITTASAATTQSVSPQLSSPHIDRSVSGSSARSQPRAYRELLRDGLLSRLRSEYPLCALLIDDYIRHLSAKEAVIRDQVIDTLRLWLCKHDYDKRWRNAKPLIATMLFPLIPAVCDEVDVLRAMEPRTRRSVLLPVLWTLHHLPSAILGSYWGAEHAEEQLGLLSLLNCALHDFAYAGIKQREAEAAGSVDALLILSPETVELMSNQAASSSRSGRTATSTSSVAAAGGVSAGSSVSGSGMLPHRSSAVDHKTDIEAYMAGVHKTKTFGGSRSKLLSGPPSSSTTSAPVHPSALSSSSLPGAHSRDFQSQQQQYATVSGASLASSSSAQAGPPTAGFTPLSAFTAHTVSTNSIHSVDKQPNPRGAQSHSIGGSSHSPHLQASVSSPALSGGSGSSVGSPAVAVSLRQMRANLAAARTVNSSSYRSLSYKTYSGGSSAVMSMSREFTMRVVRFEGVLSRQISRVVLAITSRLLASFATTLPASEQSFVEVLRVLHGFFSSPQPNTFLLSVYPCCMSFIQRYGSAVRDSSARQLEFSRLSNAVFRTLAFTHRGVRRHAVSLVYQLLVNEYVQAVDLTQLQTQFTMELSRMTDSLTLVNERCLQQTFGALTVLGDKYGLGRDEQRVPHTGSAADFRSKLTTLLGRLTTILGDSMEINRQIKLGADADSATVEALLCQVADAFSHLPEVRIEWLIRLAKHHQQQQAYAEAGECYLLIAQLAAHRKRGRIQPASKGSDASSELEAMDRVIVSYYEACVSQLDLAELYEQCSDVYSALLPFYVHYHEYSRLSKAHLHMHSIFEKLIAANRAQTRMLGTYYRVGFYGRRFGARLDGLELIYKTPKITRLSEIATRLKQLYAKQLACTVRVLPDSNPVDRSKLDPDDCVLQITFVHPHFPADDSEPASEQHFIHSNNTAHGLYDATLCLASQQLTLASTLLTYSTPRARVSFIEQGTFIRAFRFSTPFTSTGKAFGPVTEQQKRHTVLYVNNPFPAIVTAQPVVRRTETILSPIESATEDVLSRCQSIVEQVDSPHGINAKSLTQLLQGSIATQVHGGAKEICVAFLPLPPPHTGRDAQDATGTGDGSGGGSGSSAEARETLRQALLSFVSACSRALEANRRLCGTDSERDFQHSMDAMYEDMVAAMRPHLQPPSSHHARHRHSSRPQQQPTQQSSPPTAADDSAGHTACGGRGGSGRGGSRERLSGAAWRVEQSTERCSFGGWRRCTASKSCCGAVNRASRPMRLSVSARWLNVSNTPSHLFKR